MKRLLIFLLLPLFSLGQGSNFIVQRFVPPPNEIQANASNNLVDNLLTNNQLQYFDAIYSFGSVNSNAIASRAIDSKRNLVSSNFTATESASIPNWFKGYGFYGSGGGSIFLSLFSTTNTASVYAQNDCHLSILNRTHLSQGIEIGSYDGVKGSWLASRYSDNNTYLRLNSATSSSYGNLADTRGWFYGERTGAATVTLSLNGASLGSSANVSTGESGFSIYALALNQSDAVFATSQSSKKMTIATVGKSGMNQTIVYSALSNYLTQTDYQIKTVTGLGDSFMFGTNATTQDKSWFNKLCVQKHWDWVNNGVAGQAICSGGTQPGFNLANIPTKTANDYKLVVDWMLNDAYNIYYDASRTVAQFTVAVQDFFNALAGKGWTAADVIWVTGWKVDTNIWYTQAQVNTLRDYIIAACISNGAKYVTGFTENVNYPMDVDGVHPKNDQAYEIMFQYIYNVTQR
jgi:hypothetical protein